jgi:signal transduction histidine kinase
MRLWPRSLLGQMLLSVALALLVAQAISGVLLYRAGERQRESEMLNSLAFRMVRAPARSEEPRDDREYRSRRFGVGELEQLPPLVDRLSDPRREAALREILEAQGLTVSEVRVAVMAIEHDPLRRNRDRHGGLRMQPPDDDAGRREVAIAAVRSTEEGPWRVARSFDRVPGRRALGGIFLQTAIIYALLVGLLALLLLRVTRPLARLTRRVESFAGTQDIADQIEPSGPDDIQRLVRAHNRMETRIARLIGEKDVMLGAIGHDLKTPLAALRVRIESVDNEAQRAKMAKTIEEITQTLDDILTLARIGKNGAEPEKADLAALVSSVVEEYEDMGDPVTLGETVRTICPVQLTWLKRAVRNLVSNAVRYGGSAHVSLLRDGECAVIRIDDNGPGIPDHRIGEMLEPFTRGEASRNRETGGAGLGLALARAIAEQQRGELVLTNRPSGGLRAEIRLPLG